MDSVRKIYKIGVGPSSSHTMGPKYAATLFKNKNPHAKKFRVTLHGSLALTGKGHLTDKAIIESFPEGMAEVVWSKNFLAEHSNGMHFEAFNDKGEDIKSWTEFNIGSGDLKDDNTKNEKKDIYPHHKMKDILQWCDKHGRTFWEYCEMHEGKEIWGYLAEVWDTMKKAINRGLENEGVLPGILNLPRKASRYYMKAKSSAGSLQKRAFVFAYALAVSEENAAGGTIVTAPTCGSSGVVPAVLFHIQRNYEVSDEKIIRALATAGIIGNLVKENASISGADVGCQGEVGTACSMAAAAAAQLFGGTPAQIEYAAEMGLEHHLGLTCDPVAGLVQIPCIERNAFGASRAMDASAFAVISDGKHRVSFDKTCMAMKETGHDLPNIYKETSEGGLAVLIK